MIAELAAAIAVLTSPPMKTIVHARSGPLCNEYRSLVLPLERVQQRNFLLMQKLHDESSAYRKYADPIFRNGATMYASQIDATATSILQNLAPMNGLLAQSWKRSPAGKDPKVDELRRRVGNIVDIQRAIANQEVRFSGSIVDNDGMDLLTASASAFGTPSAARAPSPPPEPKTASGIAAKQIEDYPAAALETLLADESALLASTASILAYDCAEGGNQP